MANFSTLLLAIFMVMFWLFRAIVALCTQFSIDLLGIVAYNFNWEVIIAFATLLCIILVVKRKLDYLKSECGRLFRMLESISHSGENTLTYL